MKIVCDACQAKYSISDDKVQGKVFKIRCKKCSNIIVVRGGGGGAAEAAAPEPKAEKETRVYDYGYEGGDAAPAGDDAVWHVVINQDQVGPMTAAELQQRFTAGEIDAETYIWREGFSDWLPISQVDTFAAFVAGAAAPAAAPAPSGRDAVSSMFGGGGTDDTGTMRSDPGDLFAAASAQSRTSERDDDGGDLFGNRPAASAKAAAAGAEPKDAKLRGERNENSVLFSLGNLAQLASDKPAPVTSAPSGHATGAAGGEGSGLIDIRSMANAYLGAGTGGAKPATSSAIGSIDDLPVFSGGGFAEPAVFVPTARPANNNKVLYAMIGGLGLIAIVAIVLVLVLVKGGGNKTPDPTPVAAASTPGSDSAAPAPAPAPAPVPAAGSAAAAAAPTPGSAAAPAPTPGSAAQVATNDKPPPAETPAATPAAHKATPAPAPAAHDAHKAPAAPTPAAHDNHVAAATPPPAPKETPAPKDKPAAGGGDCDEVNCLLNNNEGACCAKFKKGKSKPAGGDAPAAAKGGGDLPDTLDRDMISGGVAKVKARVMACGDKSSAKGQVKVHVKVAGNGSVSSVSVSNTPDPALGNCVAAAMQKASFPKTVNGGSFGYPFVF